MATEISVSGGEFGAEVAITVDGAVVEQFTLGSFESALTNLHSNREIHIRELPQPVEQEVIAPVEDAVSEEAPAI